MRKETEASGPRRIIKATLHIDTQTRSLASADLIVNNSREEDIIRHVLEGLLRPYWKKWLQHFLGVQR
jgi:hypothetical protein